MTITIVGGNLYQIASVYLGDSSQWIRIAQANNITDPMLTGINTLIIPSVNVNLTGGVPQ